MSDISITIGSTTKLFDLAKGENRQKQMSTREEQIVPVRALSDVPSYGDLPPEKILAFVQNTWRGGMGQKDKFFTPDMYADGQSIDTREPNQIILGPLITTVGAISGTVIALEFFKDREYAATTSKVYRLSTNSLAWDEVFNSSDFGSHSIVCLGVYDGYIFVGTSTGNYCYSDDGVSWTQSTLGNSIAQLLTAAPPFSGTKDVLTLSYSPNLVRTSISPLNGGTGWLDPPYYIGDGNSSITGLLVMNGTLFIGKTDGLYALPVDGRPILVLPYKNLIGLTNFLYHTNWKGATYISAGGDILEIIGGSTSVFGIDYVGPLSKSPELATIGSIRGLTSDDRNIYALYLIGSNYIIYAGQERTDKRFGLRWEWTPYVNLGANACYAIKVMQRSGANPKLFFGYGTNMASVVLPLSPNLPLGDSSYRFCASGYLITSYFDSNYDTWAKIFYQLWTIAENLTTGITIDVHYEKDTDISWTSLTTITANGVQSVDLTSLSCKKVRLKFTLNSGTNTVTPILREFMYRGVLQPEITKTLDFTVVLGQSDSRKPSTDLTFLESGRTATAPIILKDLRFGTTKYITFLPNSPMEVEGWDEASKQPSYQARILAQQLNWTSP